MSPFIPRREIGFLLACNCVQKDNNNKKKSNQINGTASGKKSNGWKTTLHQWGERESTESGVTSEEQYKWLTKKSMLLNEGSKLTHICAQQEEICASRNRWKKICRSESLQTKEGVNNALKRALMNLKSKGLFVFKRERFAIEFLKLGEN